MSPPTNLLKDTTMSLVKEFEGLRQQLQDLPYGFKRYDLAVEIGDVCARNLDTIIAALSTEGMVMVPREPTEEMLDAARNAPTDLLLRDSLKAQERARIATYYRAMIAASPSSMERGNE